MIVNPLVVYTLFYKPSINEPFYCSFNLLVCQERYNLLECLFFAFKPPVPIVEIFVACFISRAY